MKEIPQEVIEAFKFLISMYGNNVVFLGSRNGTSYFLYEFPYDCDTGFPQVVAYKSGNVSHISGFDAVDIAASFRLKD